MKLNLSTPNRIIRLVVATTITVLYFTGTVSGTFAIVLLIMGGMMILSSLLNFCPMAISGFCPKDLVKKMVGKNRE